VHEDTVPDRLWPEVLAVTEKVGEQSDEEQGCFAEGSQESWSPCHT
jgi:hypothetical protein